jgi:CPA1 family monovalent cation:H+ antiporter
VILLLVVVLAASTAARRLGLPYPLFLVLVGLALGLAPGTPVAELEPDLVFLVFLPPILWAAAYFTSFRDFRGNLRPIGLLAIGLVLATTAAVAAVAQALLPGIGWPAAIALGAIVSPPDAVAATAIAGRIGLPRRVVTILEGESLVNDATALVLYRTAVVAAVTGAFSLTGALGDFVLAAGVGIAIGLAVGGAATLALGWVCDSLVEIAITLLAPYVAWALAERFHASSVLACVAGGLALRKTLSTTVSPLMRLHARAVWDLVVFLLNGVLFVLIGLQVGALRKTFPAADLRPLLLAMAAVIATVIAVRLAWVPLAAWLPRRLSASLRQRDPMPPPSAIALVAWTAMRGIVTLAAALALPHETAAGTPFPARGEIVLISFAVVLATLLLQGLSLPWLARHLRLPTETSLAREESQARAQAAVVALRRLGELSGEPWVDGEQARRMRFLYEERLRRASRFGSTPDAEGDANLRRLHHEVLTAERLAVVALRDDGVVGDEVLQQIEHELDVESERSGVGDWRVRRRRSRGGPGEAS